MPTSPARPVSIQHHVNTEAPATSIQHDLLTDYLACARLAASAAADRLGHDTVLIAVGDILAVTEIFVITGGSTSRQVRAIVDSIEDQVAAAGGPKPYRVEGNDVHEWVLMDYGGFVVHVLVDERRSFYDLERLWADCPRLEWETV